MSAARLTFLYPHLFRSIRVSEPVSQVARQCRHHRPRECRSCISTTSHQNDQFAERHGKAIEGYIRPSEMVKEAKTLVAENVKKGIDTTPPARRLPRLKPKDVSPTAPLSEETQAAGRIPGDTESEVSKLAAALSGTSQLTPLQKAEITNASTIPATAIQRILEMEPPVEAPPTDPEIPHMHAPPYVHHFDSYTLCKGVEQGGFTEKQAITSMKAIRSLLAYNLDIARAGLVSRGDIDNEAYLFRAACSELRTEIQNNRRLSEEKMRADRNLLQHEVDVLNQKLTAELLMLKDDLKGMFDDRRMAVRMEQRHMDSQIQELNYKITVALNSDSKSEVEGLRWHLARRSVLAIVFMAFMVLSSLRYASYRVHEEEQERKKLERLAEQEASNRLHHRGGDGESKTGDDLPAGLVAEVLSAG